MVGPFKSLQPASSHCSLAGVPLGARPRLAERRLHSKRLVVVAAQKSAAAKKRAAEKAKKARAKSKPASATATLERPKPAGKAQRPGTPKDAAAREHLARSLELPSDDEDEVDDDEDAPVMQEVDPLAAPAVARERLVTAHRDAVAAFDAQMERVCGADALAAAAAGLAPAAQDTEQPLARELLEIPVAMLQPETQHAGGALYGRVLESVVVLSAVTGLLEDEGGDVVRFSVKLGPALGIEAGEGPEGMAAAVAAARRRFAAGQRIAIRDPVYRTSKDGAATVRAEDAATVHFLPRLPFEGLHTEEALGERAEVLMAAGNAIVASAAHARAARCGAAAAAAALSSTRVANLCAELNDPQSMLCYAAAGMRAADPTVRAHACLAANGALLEMEAYTAAAWVVAQVSTRDLEAVAAEEEVLAAEYARLRQEFSMLNEQAALAGPAEFAARLLQALSELDADDGLEVSARIMLRHPPEKWTARAEKLERRSDANGAANAHLAAMQIWGKLGTRHLVAESAAALVANETADAVTAAAVAVLLEPAAAAPRLALADAVLAAGDVEEAAVMAVRIGNEHGESAALAALRRRVDAAAGSAAPLFDEPPAAADAVPEGEAAAEGGEPRMLTERELAGMTAGGDEDRETLAEVAALVLSETEAEKLAEMEADAGPRPPPLLEELSGLIPEGERGVVVRRHLQAAYGHTFGWWMLLAGSETPDPADALEVVRDSGGVDAPAVMRFRGPEHEAWARAAAHGDIGWLAHESKGYHASYAKLAHFCNRPNVPLPLRRGEAHVAVGFVDFGDLAESVAAWGDDGAAGAGPLRWHGVEASAYACAAAAVVHAMLQQGAPEDDIVQVWYSAAWSESAAASFAAAVTAAGESQLADESLDVAEVLRGWAGASVALEDAQAAWLETRRMSDLSEFRRKEDRVALCGYELTGGLLAGATGSVVMFGPRPEGELAVDHSALHSIGLDALAGEWRRGEVDVVAAAVAVLRRRARALRDAVAAGSISMRITHGEVRGADDGAAPPAVTAAAPSSMSWSNVPDYITPAAFHRLAAACSAAAATPGECAHHMHAMNWPLDVKGAWTIDYHARYGGGEREAVLESARRRLLQKGIAIQSRALSDVRARALLRRRSLHNLTSQADLAAHVKWHHAWVDAWADAAAGEGLAASVNVTRAPAYAPVQRTSSTMHLAVRYTQL